MSPDVQAMCITPICPHSLSFRPVVVSAQSTIVVMAATVNWGRRCFVMGRRARGLGRGTR